jgi:hypothetical protein
LCQVATQMNAMMTMRDLRAGPAGTHFRHGEGRSVAGEPQRPRNGRVGAAGAAPSSAPVAPQRRVSGAYIEHQLARIYLLVGEPERALDQLEPLLKMPYNLSPGWLRIDPTFAPLRGNPRFEKFVAGR